VVLSGAGLWVSLFLSAHRAIWNSFLITHFLFHCHFLQSGLICCWFHHRASVWLFCYSCWGRSAFHPTPSRVKQLRVPPHSNELSSVFSLTPARHRWIISTIYLASRFVLGGGAICPPAVLVYLIASRAGEVSHSPGMVADSLWWNWVSSSRAQVVSA
jgi:hypothetical protein